MSAALEAGAVAISAGRHARAEVDIGAAAHSGVPPELSLTASFGALLAELLPGTGYRLSKLALDYVAPERLTSKAMFSAKVSDASEGRATLSLLVYQGWRLCVRGRAEVRWQARDAAPPARARRDEHMNGESR